MKIVNKTNNYICKEEIKLIKFCPYPTSNQYLIIVSSTQLTIIEVIIEENDDLFNVEYKPIKEIVLPGVVDLSWSPITNFTIAPRHVNLLLACFDKNIVYLTTDLKENADQMILGQHESFVNSVACNQNNSEHLASTGDDCVCKLWLFASDSVKLISTISLSSPGMVVCFHPLETNKMMIAEKCGIIRFFNTNTLKAFMSIDCCKSPLVSVSWSLSNPIFVAAMAGSELLLFNTSQSSRPLKMRTVDAEIGMQVCWSYFNENIVATLSAPKGLVHIFNTKNLKNCQVLHSFELQSCQSLEFHHRLPFLFLATNEELQIRKLTFV